MFPSTEDQSAAPKAWRTKLHRAAGLVVAFATLDGYGPFASAFDAPDEHSGDLPHRHTPERRPLQAPSRRRGHGVPQGTPGTCASAPAARRVPVVASQRPGRTA